MLLLSWKKQGEGGEGSRLRGSFSKSALMRRTVNGGNSKISYVIIHVSGINYLIILNVFCSEVMLASEKAHERKRAHLDFRYLPTICSL